MNVYERIILIAGAVVLVAYVYTGPRIAGDLAPDHMCARGFVVLVVTGLLCVSVHGIQNPKGKKNKTSEQV